MNYQIESKDSFRIVGYRTRLCRDAEDNIKIISKFCQSLRSNRQDDELKKLAEEDELKLMGISIYLDDCNIYYYLGVVTQTDVPSGMHELTIPAALWTIITENPEIPFTLHTALNYFYTLYLPSAEYDYAGLPDIEIYKTDDTKLNTVAEVWFAVQSGSCE